MVAVSPRSETTLPRTRTVWFIKESRYLALIRGVASDAIDSDWPQDLGYVNLAEDLKSNLGICCGDLTRVIRDVTWEANAN